MRKYLLIIIALITIPVYYALVGHSADQIFPVSFGNNYIGNFNILNGSVGIGTASPDAKLDIELSSGGALEVGSAQTSATGDYAIALGYGANATAAYATAIGIQARSHGVASTTIGQGSDTYGLRSTAIGYNVHADANYSTAIGTNSRAGGRISIALGDNVHTYGNYSTAMGRHITVNGTESFGIGLDNNSYTITQNNAMAIMGGNVGIGTASPTQKLTVAGSTNISTGSFTISDLSACDTIDTDANGTLRCGTDASGGGGKGKAAFQGSSLQSINKR